MPYRDREPEAASVPIIAECARRCTTWPAEAAPLLLAACAAVPRYLPIVSAMPPLPPTGVAFSDGLALVAALELINATHYIESGMAGGHSTELVARAFEGRGRRAPLQIHTFEDDSMGYGLYESTRDRLAKWPNVVCHRANAILKMPQLLSSLPKASRVFVFVDGPKYEVGYTLLQQMLGRFPIVLLGGLHDAAPYWSVRLNGLLHGVREQRLLLTSEQPWRGLFSAAMDETHGERAAMERLASATRWPSGRLNATLSTGSGAWLGGRPHQVARLALASKGGACTPLLDLLLHRLTTVHNKY